MKIKVDREGMNLVGSVCDAALRGSGLQALDVVNKVIHIASAGLVAEKKADTVDKSTTANLTIPEESDELPEDTIAANNGSK